jgi:cytochrome P450
VLNHTLSLHRNPRCFSPYSDAFWPDRWLPERDREKLPFNETFILDHAAYIPFSYGPASCVGKNLALLEMRAVICYVVQKFGFKVKEGFRIDAWEDGIGDFFVVKSPALPVVVEAQHQFF